MDGAAAADRRMARWYLRNRGIEALGYMAIFVPKGTVHFMEHSTEAIQSGRAQRS